MTPTKNEIKGIRERRLLANEVHFGLSTKTYGCNCCNCCYNNCSCCGYVVATTFIPLHFSFHLSFSFYYFLPSAAKRKKEEDLKCFLIYTCLPGQFLKCVVCVTRTQQITISNRSICTCIWLDFSSSFNCSLNGCSSICSFCSSRGLKFLLIVSLI